jgi:hypothetical protein
MENENDARSAMADGRYGSEKRWIPKKIGV